jgi:hypothetical protein
VAGLLDLSLSFLVEVIAFIAMILISQAVLVLAVSAFGSGGTWESPKS